MYICICVYVCVVAHVFREAFKVFVFFFFFLVFWLKNRVFQKGDGSDPLLQFFGCGGCWWMLVLDDKKGGGKKPVKQVFVCHPLLERRSKVKIRERPEVKRHHHFYTCLGDLKNGQEVITPFGARKSHVKRNVKTLSLKRFQEEVGGNLFLGKGYVT